MISIKDEQFSQPLAEDQDEYNTLYVNFNEHNPMGPTTVCFELSNEEIDQILKNKKIYYQQCLFTKAVRNSDTSETVIIPREQFHPMSLHVNNPLDL